MKKNTILKYKLDIMVLVIAKWAYLNITSKEISALFSYLNVTVLLIFEDARV